jgi:ABC-2 type transport system ATP-binding protein
MMNTVVSAANLSKFIGAKSILRDISVEVTSGHVVGILGKNGAGKTTLLEVLLGFSPPTSGSSSVFGSDSLRLPVHTKQRIGFVPQRDELINEITGAQQLSLIGSLSHRWNGALIERLVASWEIPLNTRIKDLSGGERQKLSTILALGHEPELLVLDEPASSLDPIARRLFLREILDIAADEARTVLFSTHIVSDLERVANRVVIVREGDIAWAGDLDTLKETVVRLHVDSRHALPAAFGLDHVIRQQVAGTRASIVASHWNPDLKGELERRLDAEISVEQMGLEDIFVELHS